MIPIKWNEDELEDQAEFEGRPGLIPYVVVAIIFLVGILIGSAVGVVVYTRFYVR